MKIVRFTKQDKSTFPYWFAHWCSFQLTALNMKAWRPGYLLHDAEKPWMKIWYNMLNKLGLLKLNPGEVPYDRVKKFHRENSAHHLEYKGGKKDYKAMLIDWECARLTKKESPRDAIQQLELERQQGNLSDEDIAGLVKAATELGLYNEN